MIKKTTRCAGDRIANGANINPTKDNRKKDDRNYKLQNKLSHPQCLTWATLLSKKKIASQPKNIAKVWAPELSSCKTGKNSFAKVN